MTTTFRYCEYTVEQDRRTVRLVYESCCVAECHRFTETLVFPVDLPETENVHTLLRLLHFAAGTSYYKLFLPESIVHPYTITRSESSFWSNVFQHGLREFIFTNRLSADRIAAFPDGSAIAGGHTGERSGSRTVLLGIGGGKDSVVAGELLKALGLLAEAFVVVSHDVPAHVAGVARKMDTDLLVVRRQIDSRLRELAQSPGTYNGHIPISAIFAIVGCLVAVGRGHGYVAVGNESTASIPNTVWRGLEINHQWSKSLQFEQWLQSLLAELGCGVDYFSPIRPLNAISVAALFARYPEYFHVFTSDSSSFRIDPQLCPSARWTLGSAKSLSSYILLLPWLDEPEMKEIFGRDFLDEPQLESMLRGLLGTSTTQLFDCVGTPHELRLCLDAARAQGKCLNSRLVRRVIDDAAPPGQAQDTGTLRQQLRVIADNAFPQQMAAELSATIQARLAACRPAESNGTGNHEALV